MVRPHRTPRLALAAAVLVLTSAAASGRIAADAQEAVPAPPAPHAAPVPAPAVPAPGRATATDERLRRVHERREALQHDLDALRKQEKTLLGEVEALELAVRVRSEELKEAQLVLQRTNERMDATVKRLRELEGAIAAARPVLAARARALYKLGELSYLRILLSVDHPSDMFRGYRFVTALARRDNARIVGFRSNVSSLQDARTELEKRTREAQGLRAGLERTRRSLDADRQKKTQLLTDIVEKKEIHAAYVEELEKAEESLGRLLGGSGEAEVAVPIAAFRGTLPWPVEGKVRTPFGLRKHPKFDTYTVQNGIDIEAPADAPVVAVHEGTVAFAERFSGYGLMVVVDHGDKHHSLYAQLGEIRVQPGQHVAAGDVVGTVGASGLEGPGLYFEIRYQGKPQDPGEWLGAR